MSAFVLMIACGIAAITAIVVTMPFITKPKYQATHIFYPTKNNSISDALLTDARQRQKDPLEFGEEEEAEKARADEGNGQPPAGTQPNGGGGGGN
jgi:hypothetical protein